jgi:hypothetical protein
MERLITLVDRRNARIGFEFLHGGRAEACEGCPLASACLENLEEGRKYRVIGVEQKEHGCRLDGVGKVRVVRVEMAEVPASLDARGAIEGAKTVFRPKRCSHLFCENWKYCDPEGLKEGDWCEITALLGPLPCERGQRLERVMLKKVS